MSEQTVYGAAEADQSPRTKVRTLHLQKWKAEGHKWAMLTAYDYSTARIFDDAGIPCSWSAIRRPTWSTATTPPCR